MRKKSAPDAGRKLATPRRADWPFITEFAYRCDYFRRWLLAAVFGAFVLGFAGLFLSAVGVFLLFPLYGALTHLRCPSCNAATTAKGVTDGHHCLSCGQRLRI